MNAPTRSLRYVFMALAFALCLPFAPLAVQAQDSASTPETTTDSAERVSFSIHPANDPNAAFIDNLTIEPGSSVTVDVMVRNAGASPVDLRLYTTNAHNGTNGGFNAGTRDEEPVGQTLWIDFPTQEFTVGSEQHQIVSLTISVPADAAPGQYITALVAETVDTMPLPGSTSLDHRIRYSMSVGILVPGDLHHSFELGEPDASSGSVIIPITNTGNYLVRPEGQIRLVNSSGDEVIDAEMTVRSVYAGNSTYVSIGLPEQVPSGDYVLDLTLTDPESGASAEIASADLFVPEAADPLGLTLTAYQVVPSGDPIVLLDVNAMVTNGGTQLPAANVILEVSRDGELIEEYDVATNQVLLSGDNEFTARYIPADGSWEPGTYTFTIVVSFVNMQDNQEVELLRAPMEGEITVP